LAEGRHNKKNKAEMGIVTINDPKRRGRSPSNIGSQIYYVLLMKKDDRHVGRWYNERLNKHYYLEHILKVGDNTNLHLRRSNDRIGNSYNDISSKLEIIGFHINSIMNRLNFGKELLPEMLVDLSEDLSSNKAPHIDNEKQKDLWIEFYDYEVTVHLEGLLIQAKALLDSLSQSYSLGFSRDIRTFSKSGKNILNDLKSIKSKHPLYSANLIDLIEDAKVDWIDTLIKYRDLVAHFGQLREFRCQMLKLTEKFHYEPEDVNNTKMPDGTDLDKYCSDILNHIHDFSAEFVRIVHLQLGDESVKSAISKNKINRNSPCPCGSGHRYKNCHGKVA